MEEKYEKKCICVYTYMQNHVSTLNLYSKCKEAKDFTLNFFVGIEPANVLVS